MGFLSRIFGRDHHPHTRCRVIGDVNARGVSPNVQGLVKISGTTTFKRDAANSVGVKTVGSPPGYGVETGWLQNEYLYSSGSRTISVKVEGVTIGSLPSYLVNQLNLNDGERIQVPVQIFTSDSPKGFRVDAWTWIGDTPPKWEYSVTSRPPVTTGARAAEHHTQVQRMVADALKGGGNRAAEFRAGMVDGAHYLELIEPIKQLKRESRLDEALALAYQAIEGAERSARADQKRGISVEPAPWYTIQAAIIHRKLKQREQEVAVLERWLCATPKSRREGSKVAERLAKLKK